MGRFQENLLAIPQQRQNFPKNGTINGKKVSVLLFFSKAARRYRHPSANNKSPTETVLDEESELRIYSNDPKI
jgi:hypothetical protein